MKSRSGTSVNYLYNPQNLSKSELIDSFIIRQKTFQRIFKEVKRAKMQHPEQHILIQGKRGMGKTTMLLRLNFEVENDRALSKWLIPLVFNEEEYSVRKLFKLWERIAELLEDQRKEFRGIRNQMKYLSASNDSDEAYEKAGFELLINTLREKKQKIILFIDNASDMFAKFSDKDAHRFRKILQTSPDLRIVAASAVPIRSFHDYRHPFYEFFKIEYLDGLNTEETFELLSELGKRSKQKNLPHNLHEFKGRIEALRRLSGGVVRTILLLYELFVDDENGDAFQDLETILDRVTPLYKHRMDDLPAQQQAIVEAIALHWDAISVKEIAEQTRLESKVVSAQLSLLVKNDIVHKIRTTTKNNLYQISERFFNIWYLMRNGRSSDQNRVIWLVRFLEEWCDEVEITQRAKQHMDYLQNGQYDSRSAYHMTEALAFTKHLPGDIQHELLEKTRSYLSRTTKPLAKKLSSSDLALHRKAMPLFNAENYTEAVSLLQKMKHKDYLRMAFSFEVLEDPKKAEVNYLKAIEAGQPEANYFLAYFYEHTSNNYKSAEKYYQLALQDENAEAAFALGNMYLGQKKFTKAEKAFRQATELGNLDARLMLIFMDIAILKNPDSATSDFIQLLNENTLLVPDFEFSPERSKLIGLGLYFLLSQGHQAFLYHFFNTEKAIDKHFKDRFKPIYYATLYFLQDQYPNEYLRMGTELKQTVEEIVERVEAHSIS